MVVGCEMPLVDAAAVEWLLAQTGVGRDVVMPRPGPDAACEPLFALYEPTCRPSLEGAALEGRWSLQEALAGERLAQPLVPPALRKSWRRVKTPEK